MVDPVLGGQPAHRLADDDRIAAVVRQEEVRHHRVGLAVAMDTTDTLVVDARAPVQLTEDHGAANLLESVEACSSPE